MRISTILAGVAILSTPALVCASPNNTSVADLHDAATRDDSLRLASTDPALNAPAQDSVALGALTQRDRDMRMDDNTGMYGPVKGDWEFIITGTGASNQDFDNHNLGINASLGYFLTDDLEVAIRQGFTYIDTNNSAFAGSTRVALDYHFDLDRWRPFVGANFGGIYGDGTTDTFAAGLEGGVKYYVKSQTFIFGLAEYQWLFDSGNEIDNQFDDGQFVYSIGIGFNF